MKRLAYITVVILSLLIIYSGAGVPIAHYCRSRREIVQGYYIGGCPRCKRSYTCDSRKDCKEEGCTAIIYKSGLMKHISELTVSVLVIVPFCEQHCQLLALTFINRMVDFSSLPSPLFPYPRQKPALYSVFLIQLLLHLSCPTAPCLQPLQDMRTRGMSITQLREKWVDFISQS